MVETGAVLKLASAIQVQEGWYPGSLSYRNNNPGNLRYAGQSGATAGAGGFAAFPTYQAGLSALVNQIQLDASRGTDAAGRPVVTVSDLIYSWAPPADHNNTAAYVASIEKQTGFGAGDVLNSLAAGGGDSTQGGAVDDPGSYDAGSDAPASLPTSALVAVGVAGASVLWLALR